MIESPQSLLFRTGWRFHVPVGLGIGLGMAAARDVESKSQGSLGPVGAFVLALLVAGVVGALTAGVAAWLLRRRSDAAKAKACGSASDVRPA